MKDEDQLIKEMKDTINELSHKHVLFETISYHNQEQINEFYNNMTQEQAIACIIEAGKSAYRRGVYSLYEAEALSKSIRVLGFPE